MGKDVLVSFDTADCDPPTAMIDPWVAEWLTPRERTVLSLLAEGQCNKLMAHNIDVAESTVKLYVSSIMRKLGCTNRVQAALIAFCLTNDLRSNLNRLAHKVRLQKSFSDRARPNG